MRHALTLFQPEISVNETILKVESMSKRFPKGQSFFFRPACFINAVDGISFSIKKAESFGLLGESGSGKTTAGKLILKLYKPDSGKIYFNMDGEPADITTSSPRETKIFRRKAQMISQDPYESLNPRMTVFDIVSEPLLVHREGNPAGREEKVVRMLRKAGITPPEQYLFRYPHELSGGQRQRVSIARALVLNPSFILADEPTSMLDVSIRAGIIELLSELQQEFGISFLFITHDFAVARYVCKRIAVMYAGKILETGYTEEIIKNPLHPYTKALLEAVPTPEGLKREAPAEETPPGEPDRDICRYYSRCDRKDAQCRKKPHPEPDEAGAGRLVSCYRI